MSKPRRRASPTRISKEVDAAETMVQRTEERFALKPERIAGDVAYGTGEMLGWLVAHDIEPHVPVWDRTEVATKGKFSRNDFSYDKERDLYVCSGGKELKTSGTVHDGTTIKYIAKRSDCPPMSAQTAMHHGPGTSGLKGRQPGSP